MKMKRYLSADMRSALKAIREEQGPDAVILSTRRTPEGVEVCAAIDVEVSDLVAVGGRAGWAFAAGSAARISGRIALSDRERMTIGDNGIGGAEDLCEGFDVHQITPDREVLQEMESGECRKGQTAFAIWPFLRKVARLLADLRDVLGGWTLLALHDFELDALAFGEGLEARSTNRGMMNEAILRTILRRDESKALRVVEPLYSTGRTHSFVLFLFWSEWVCRTTMSSVRDHCPHDGDPSPDQILL